MNLEYNTSKNGTIHIFEKDDVVVELVSPKNGVTNFAGWEIKSGEQFYKYATFDEAMEQVWYLLN